ncbi:MAG: hypothetical protein GY951_05435 [Psychromonas sp.]|nr:hypothetical protein [Psychromonas sp.]
MSFERRATTSCNSCLDDTRFSCVIQDHLLNALGISNSGCYQYRSHGRLSAIVPTHIVTLNDNEVVGVFDFDTAPRIWEIAFFVYCRMLFKTDSIDRLASPEQQIHRAKLFCDSYCTENLVETMVKCLQ